MGCFWPSNGAHWFAAAVPGAGPESIGGFAAASPACLVLLIGGLSLVWWALFRPPFIFIAWLFLAISSWCFCMWILVILEAKTFLVSSKSGLFPTSLLVRNKPSLDASYMFKSSINLLASSPRSSYLSILQILCVNTVAKSGYFQSSQNEIPAYCPADLTGGENKLFCFLSKLSGYFWHGQLSKSTSSSLKPPVRPFVRSFVRSLVRPSVRPAQLFTGRAVVSQLINVKEIPDTIAQRTPQTAPSSPLHNPCGKASFTTLQPPQLHGPRQPRRGVSKGKRYEPKVTDKTAKASCVAERGHQSTVGTSGGTVGFKGTVPCSLWGTRKSYVNSNDEVTLVVTFCLYIAVIYIVYKWYVYIVPCFDSLPMFRFIFIPKTTHNWSYMEYYFSGSIRPSYISRSYFHLSIILYFPNNICKLSFILGTLAVCGDLLAK